VTTAGRYLFVRTAVAPAFATGIGANIFNIAIIGLLVMRQRIHPRMAVA
jgi:hypothetical protein